MRPLLLIVLDGFGQRDAHDGNAIALANMPFWQSLLKKYPHTTLQASGEAVGLPAGQMGNSEVGHITLGAGRIIDQDLLRIQKSMQDGSFYSNVVLQDSLDFAKTHRKRLHVLGLTSIGGVHAHLDHGLAVVEAAKRAGLTEVHWHAILDGRDTPPRSAVETITHLEERLERIGVGSVASLVGRFYAMDRDQRWDRTQVAYDLLVQGRGTASPAEQGAAHAVQQAYERGETDEFVQPIVMMHQGRPRPRIEQGDSVVFFNFRADRARQLTQAFVDPAFSAFVREKRPDVLRWATFSCYDQAWQKRVPTLFQTETVLDTLGEQLSTCHVRQLRVAETEKYAHVTYFFNGGREMAYPGEDRQLIQSNRQVKTYDQDPKMRAAALSDAVMQALQAAHHGFILVNFANPDMLGHTGSLPATIAGLEEVDRCLQNMVTLAMQQGVTVAITADHGNCEQMFDVITGQPHTAHTSHPVPFVLISAVPTVVSLREGGGLQDVAPTLLSVMQLPIPQGMRGTSLLRQNHLEI